MSPYKAASDPADIAGTPWFAGRATLLRTLQTNLPKARSYAVLAGPKTGRTALLRQLAWLEKQKARAGGAATATWVPVYLDLRAAHVARPQLFFDALYTALCKAVLDPWMQGTDRFARAPKVDFKLEKNPAEKFEAACAELWQDLANTPGWCRWALLCDNAEVLTERGVPRGAAEQLFAMSDAAEAHRPGGMLWVGAPPLADILSTGPLTAMRRLPMGVLREAEAQSVYRAAGRPQMPYDAPWEVCLEASGRHPLILTSLVQAAVAQPDVAFDDLRAACAPKIEEAFGQYLALMGPMHDTRGAVQVPHALMQNLMAGGDMSVAEAEDLLGMRPVREAADMLEACAVVERAVRGNKPTLRAGNPWWNSWYGRNAGEG